MKRKYLALFLILALAACLFPVSAFAAAGDKAVNAESEDVVADADAAEAPEDAAEVQEEDAVEFFDSVGDDPMPPDALSPEELAAAAALADQILSDGAVTGSAVSTEDSFAVVVSPDAGAVLTGDADTITVAPGETAYAYEGMTVYNNGGTVFNNLAVVYNNGGTVYTNGGTVYNNAGVVYANHGSVFNNAGKVYNNEASVFSFSDDDIVSSSRVFRYYELKFADYYEPFILADGVVVEPGSERMLIGEDSVCRISPYPGFVLKAAETDAGDLIWDNEDGSVSLANVDADTTLKLTLQADAPAFSLESGSYASEQTLAISGPAGCQIFYSLDGSTPDEESGVLYEDAFPVKETCTVRAVAVVDGVEPSEVSKLKLSFLSFTAPEFAEEKEGYFRPVAQAIMVKNPGTEDLKIVSVILDGKDADAFSLSSESGKTIPAGGLNDTKWTVRPVKNLTAGVYEAVAVFTLENGETVEVPLSFTVVSDADVVDAEADARDAEMPEDDVLPNENTEPEDFGV